MRSIIGVCVTLVDGTEYFRKITDTFEIADFTDESDPIIDLELLINHDAGMLSVVEYYDSDEIKETVFFFHNILHYSAVTSEVL